MHTKRIVASACLRCAVPLQIFVRPKHTKLFVAEASCRSDLQARVSRLAMVKKKKVGQIALWAIENFAVKHLPVARGYT